MTAVKRDRILLFLLFAIAGFLRIYEIESKNLWFDEIYSWKISCGSFVRIISETAGDIHPPLYYFLLKIWIFVFSDSVFSMRMLSAGLGLASMYILYRITVILFIQRTMQILVLILFAVSPLNIFYSQEVRMLNLNLFLTLSSVFFMLKYIRKPDAGTGIAYSAATALSLYTHYFALFILLAEVAYALNLYRVNRSDRERLKPFFKYPSFAFAMFVPWLPIMAGQALRGQPWRVSQSIGQTASDVFNYFKDIFLSVYFPYESMFVMYLSHTVALLVILFLLLSVIRAVNSRFLMNDPPFVAVLLFIIPLSIAILVSLRQSIVFSRYLSIIIPYLFITIVYFAFRFHPGSIAKAICLILAAVSVYGTVINYSNDFKNNDYRRVINHIEKNLSEGDHLIVEPHFMGWAISYYNLHSEQKLPDPEILGWNIDMQTDSLAKRDDIRKLWLVLDYSSLEKTRYDEVPLRLSEIGFAERSQKSFYLIPEKVKVIQFEKVR